MISEVHFLLVNVDKLIKNQESKNRNTFQSKISTSRKDGFQRTQKIINDLLCHYSPIVNHFYVIFLFMLSFHQCVLLHVCSSMLCTVLMSRFFFDDHSREVVFRQYSGGMMSPAIADLHLPSSLLPHTMELSAVCRQMKTTLIY